MRGLRILFATIAPLRQGPAGPTSDLASARYRVIIPAQQLARLGHQVQIASLPKDGWPAEIAAAACDTLVISKSFDEPNERLARAMKARGVRVVVDFCDDYFSHPKYGAHFHALAAIADTLVASTEAMAESVRRNTSREAVVITDPVEGPRGVPKFEPRFPAFRLAWFGHPSNLNGLLAKAGELKALAAHVPVRLSVVTAPLPEVPALVAKLAEGHEGRIRADLVPWSLEATWKTLAETDATWIPVIDSERKAVKSPNRLLESAWAGRLAVADPVPAYLPFADLMPIGEGLERGMMKALEDTARVEDNLREMQRRIARSHSAFACGREWAAAVGDAAVRPVRLNLGCGDKILPGYVNVDVVEARAGMKPDVVCDLHDLAPFDDASADEILSVHVVEHFWRWEIRDVLREWVRVLKPGGKMVVECPNILSACRTFLENPAQFSREGQDGQRTMWVFYGDPKWKDPLMIHRWGYTPESLRDLLGEVGLTDVRQEPAQFKLREPRDMRIVGTKP
jgi:SAM-dependent methyltransferase